MLRLYFAAQPLHRVSLALLAAVLTIATVTGRAQPQAPTIASPSDPYPNFDIRTYKDDPRFAADDSLASYMAAVPAPPATAADALVAGRSAAAALRTALPGVRVEINALGGADVVSAMPGSPFLTGPNDNRVAALRGFLQTHAAAYGLDQSQPDEFVVVADEMNPAGNIAWVELEQRLHGIPVFQGHMRGAFTAKGELARTNGLVATGIAGALPSSPALSAASAVAIAAADVGLSAVGLTERERRGDKIVFERGAMAGEPRAWLVYFPLAPGVARLAWATEVIGDPLGFLTVVDAETGTIVFRKNLTDFQTQAATYNVYTSDSPAPASPSPALPGANYVAPVVSRVNVTRIGNEAPYTFNALGWITDGNNTTDGNNVEAGIDRVVPDGVDAPVAGTNRVFSFAYNPGPGNPAPGDAPLTPNYQGGEVTNMFYWVNRFHDETYLLGFTEAFFNFQNDNFGRGGTGLDRISAETQDSSGTNNANFLTLADGARGRMQMFIWTGPTPDYGGGLDQDVVIHELTHGLSNRLHGNNAGLSTNMSRGLGEGWSDFYARALLSDASENVNGNYTVGGWATEELVAGVENYYYGIRRFPYAVKTSLGTNGRPHNPLTFADIDSTQADLTDGAFPQNPAFGTNTARDQVHEMGQIWAMMLLEVRARFITRLGFTEGNRRILQFVTDGMKGDPTGPTFLTARDSILAAANAGGGTQADIDDIWAGFATRGLGVTAQILVAGSNNTTRVVESYLRPGDPVPTFTINDVSATEGNAGTKTFAFTVSLAGASGGPSTVSYATADGTATAATGSPVGTSAGPISLPAGAPGTTSGPAGPYPITLNLAGVTGTITSLSVRLDGLTHTYPSDLDMLLVGPGGQRSMFMSDVGGAGDVSNLTLTFEDGAAAPSTTQLVAGTYAPTDVSPGDAMAAPAPAGPYTSALSTFNGTDPNGTWNLYIVDDVGGDFGSLTSFTLLMATTTTVADYQTASGVLSFPPGTTSQLVNVTVIGGTTPESDETFFVNLTNPGNAVIGDAQGLGTILNDDGMPPTATSDAYSTPFATTLTVPDPGVLGNDSANGGGALTAAVVTLPSHGNLNFVPTGGFSYTPAAGFAGTDSFTYRVQSAIGLTSADATVTLTVNQPTTAQPPTGFYVSSVVGNRATFRWTPPAMGPAATGFIFEGGVTPGGVIASLPLGPLPIFTIDVPSGTFFVRVRAVSGASVSGVSNEAPLFVNVPAPPSAPANLLGLVNGGTLALTWRNTFGGSAPTGGILDVTGDVTASLPVGASETLSFPGVPGGTYTLRMRSTTAGGASAASNAVTLSFPGACSGAPQTPSQFLAYRVGSQVYIVWESPTAGPAPTNYVLHATGTVTASLPLGATSFTSPVPSGTYNLSVSAANACGASAATVVQTVTVP